MCLVGGIRDWCWKLGYTLEGDTAAGGAVACNAILTLIALVADQVRCMLKVGQHASQMCMLAAQLASLVVKGAIHASLSVLPGSNWQSPLLTGCGK